MRFKPIELICILVCEYLAGLMMFLGACKTIDRIFRYPIKKYTAKSFLFANVHLVLVYLFLCIHVGVDSWYTVIIFSFIIWFFLMEKNVKSLLVSLLASIFSDVVCYGASSIISYFYVWFDLNGGSNSIYKFYLGVFGNTMGFFIALLYILFLGYIGKGKTDEPISVLNMFALLISVFLLSMIMTTVYNIDIENRYQPLLIGYVGITAAVVLSLKSSESRFYSRISKVNENYLNAQTKYYDSRQRADHEIRRIKHDMKNHMICINELSKKGNYKELEKYISEITDLLKESDTNVHVGNDIADAIINEKLSKAKRSRINLSISGTFETSDYAPIDICTILANLLDNAIEATELLDESVRRISLSFKQNQHFFLITVTNPNDKLVDVSKTGKGDTVNHGFGISNAKKSAEKYGGEISFQCEESESGYIFTAEVVLPKKQ